MLAYRTNPNSITHTHAWHTGDEGVANLVNNLDSAFPTTGAYADELAAPRLTH